MVLFAFVLPEHCFKRRTLKLLNVIEQFISNRLELLLHDASRAFNHVVVPGLLVHYLIGGIHRHRPKEAWFPLEHAIVEQHEITEHLSHGLLLLVIVSDESISLHKTKD